MQVYGPDDEKTKAVREMFESGTGVIRDLRAERAEFQRMIDRQSEVSREYNRGKFKIEHEI